MKNYWSYLLYYIKHHLAKSIVYLLNTIILVISLFTDVLKNIQGARLPTIIFSACLFLWSFYDSILSDALSISQKRYSITDDTGVINRLQCETNTQQIITVSITTETPHIAHAFWDTAINTMLICNSEIPFQEDNNYHHRVTSFINEHKEYLFDLLANQHKEAKISHKLFFNEKKLCLTYDLKTDTIIAKYHKGSYFDTFLTNLAVTQKILSNTNETLFNGQNYYPQQSNKLLPLEESGMNNEIGVSILGFTRDHRMIIWTSTSQNQSSSNMLVPSGSGSADWNDRNHGNTLKSVIGYAMKRELFEECKIKSPLSSEEIVSEIKLIGYFRWLEKGAKPEFLGVTFMNCTLTELKPAVKEVCSTIAFRQMNIDPFNADSIISAIDSLTTSNSYPLSLPLYMNLLALKDYILTKDLGHLDPAVQAQRVQFLEDGSQSNNTPPPVTNNP